MEFNISSEQELSLVVGALNSQLEKRVFVFDGPMGAGKTTLAGQFVRSLGVTDPISSPTYSIVNTYLSEKYGEVYHFDFYRLEDEIEAMNSGLDELLDSDQICIIEWAERIQNLLPESYVRVSIDPVGSTSRKIRVE